LYGFWDREWAWKWDMGAGNPNPNPESEFGNRGFLFLTQWQYRSGLVSPYLYCYALIICLQTIQKQRVNAGWFVFKGCLSGAGSEKEGLKRGFRGFFVCLLDREAAGEKGFLFGRFHIDFPVAHLSCSPYFYISFRIPLASLNSSKLWAMAPTVRSTR